LSINPYLANVENMVSS